MFRKILYLIVMFTLIACGGSDAPVTGNCTSASSNPALNDVCQAILTPTTAEAFVADTVTATLLGMALSFGPDMSITEPQINEFLAQSNGCNAGSVQFQESFTSPPTGITYSAYDNCIGYSVSGVTDIVSSTFSTPLTMGTTSAQLERVNTQTSNAISFTNQIGGEVVIFKGWYNIEWTSPFVFPVGYTIQLTQGTFYDSAGAVLFDVDNVTIDSVYAVDQQQITIDGLIIRPNQGFVSITTNTRLTIPTSAISPGYSPQTGEFVMQGDSENATVTYSNGVADVVITPFL